MGVEEKKTFLGGSHLGKPQTYIHLAAISTPMR